MTDASRRTFLAMTGAGAVAAGAAVLVPEALATTTSQDDTQAEASSSHHPGELIVAYLHDTKSGHLSVVAGEHEIHIVDKALAAKLASYARASK
jgi:hypothetical protein